MRWLICGAGSIGLALASRLQLAGAEVCVLSRREAVLGELAGGLRLLEQKGAPKRIKLSLTVDAAYAGKWVGEGIAAVCVRRGDTEEIAAMLGKHAPLALPLSLQNGVGNVEVLARHLPALGGVWRQTCMLRGHTLACRGQGRIVLGLFPAGTEVRVSLVVSQLRQARYSVSQSAHIQQDIWLKLCLNLLSAISVLASADLKERAEYWSFRRSLLCEARDTLVATGISAKPCDDKDPDLDEMIRRQDPPSRKAAQDSSAAIQVFNSVHTALLRGQELEPLHYHGTICELAGQTGLKCPANAGMLNVLRQQNLSPACLQHLPD